MSASAAADARMQLFLTAPPLPLLLKLASPNVLAFLVQATVSMAEVWYVGQLGTVPLAAVALVFPCLMLMQMLANGALGGAVTGAVARTLGAGDGDTAQRLVWHVLVLAVGLGLAFMVLLWLGLEALLALISPAPEVTAQAQRYAVVLALGAPSLWLMALLSSVYRGAGNMRLPALLMVVGAVIQIPLSGALILGWFGLPSLGVAGAAVSVVSVSTVSALLLVLLLSSQRSPLPLRRRFFQLRRDLFWRIARVGLPSTLSPIFTVSTILAVNALVAGGGAAALAGYGIASRIEFLMVPVVFGLGVAMNTTVGVSLGAGQRERALRLAWTGAFCAAFLTGLIGLMLAIFPSQWSALFTDDPEALLSANRYLRIVGPCFAFQGLGLSLYFASQGAGQVAWPIIATICRFVVAVGLAALLSYGSDLSLDGIYGCSALGMVLYGVITAIALRATGFRKGAAAAGA